MNIQLIQMMILVDYTYNENNNTIDVLITSENSIPKTKK